MKSYYKKLAVSALAASMILPIAACNKQEEQVQETRSGMVISKDTQWYEATHINVDFGIDKTKPLEYCMSKFAGADDKYIFVSVDGLYKNPDSMYIREGDTINNIAIADRNTGEMVKIIDATKLFEYDDYWVSGVNYRKGVLECVLGIWDMELKKQIYKLVEFDPFKEKVMSERDVDEGYVQRQVSEVGDYRLNLCPEMTEEGLSYYALDIIKGTGANAKITRAELKEEGRSVMGAPFVLPLDKKNVMIPAAADSEAIYYLVNLENGQVSKGDSKEYEWINQDYAYSTITGSDGNTYYAQGTGISKFDTNKKQINEVINFSWCNAKKSLSHFDVSDVSGDSILLSNSSIPVGDFGYVYIDSYSTEQEFVSLRKAANPHAGKKVLELYSPYGWIDEVIYNKITEFNAQNDKYYMVVTDRYTSVAEGATSEDPDEASNEVIQGMSKISNKLAMDIINGKGPDIYFDGFSMPLNYSEHLVDLTPYIGDLPKDKYFTNVVDLSKQDGKLYFMPIAVYAEGILTDEKNAGKSGEGFTTDEYAKFLKEQLNGVDTIEGTSQPYYFVTLFNVMRSKFIKDGKADFTGEDFKAIADFVKDNVPEKARPRDAYVDIEDELSDPYFDDGYVKKAGLQTTTGQLGYYFQTMDRISDNAVLMGLPSATGAGPSAGNRMPFAISAHSIDKDACGEFLKMLLADDTQQALANRGYVTLNRDAFREAGYKAVDYFNTVSVSTHYEEGGHRSKNRVTFTKKHIDQLEQTILNCTTLGESDPDIEKILVEEMPAYFSGQKSFEETIKVAQDRVQKVLDERK